ncbi:GGDEF domain-containing protein [Modestobacter sp. VKM Ac-2983]|uniref:GGDEF domain-containing protein n=1 Tax=Modestobacter sp. VKM Ac-2983 TaxID=3004137 RepID=UPI0022AB7F06|nr:GGDEF domain-containing protein [Modestobacter sp. VKM Ac-2983]MCZ2807562.1 GGDEF domain-containing protein [Modestobacter sp. VKM Ac-2983]
MTDAQLAQLVLADWQAACRAHDVLANLPVPDSLALVKESLARALGTGGSPDVVLSALAAGLAAGDWHASGEVLQLQIGLLMQVLARQEGADHRRAARVHTVLSAAAARVAVEAWRDKAEQDELTGLRNRAGWERDAKAALTLAQPLAYASIDLDGLKAINNSQGHPAGDKVLREFGQRLEIAVNGRGGASYRYGGDEFSAMLPSEAGSLADILAELAATSGVPAFSHGVAVWPDDDVDLHTVVSKADERMYEVKAQRRTQRSKPDQ